MTKGWRDENRRRWERNEDRRKDGWKDEGGKR